MLKIKLVKGNLTVTMPLVRPLLQFQPIPALFFEMIHEALTPEFPVTPAELSAGSGFKLSEVFAKFNLYGGPNAVTLFSDRLLFEFSNLVQADYPIVYNLMRKVHDRFPISFPTVDYDRLETGSYIHFEIEPPGDVNDYLKRFQTVGSLEPFAEIGEFVSEPIGRFSLIATDQSWQCKFGVEKSFMAGGGIFVDLNMVLRNQSKAIPFMEKLALAERIGGAARAVLELEYAE